MTFPMIPTQRSTRVVFTIRKPKPNLT